VIASPGSVEAQRAFILGDPKPEADVGNLARPITDVVSSPHSKRAMTVSGQGPTKNPIVRLASDSRHWGLKSIGNFSRPLSVNGLRFP
jgi:hypothetical protein